MDSAITAAAFLAVIALSDGLRLLPAGAIVLCHVWWRGWHVVLVTDRDSGDRPRLMTWCSPLMLPLMLSARREPPLPVARLIARFRARHARTRGHVLALRVGGVLTLVSLVAGIPLLTSRSGIWGLLVATAAVFLLSLGQAVVAMLGMRRAGRSRRKAAAACLRLCWPFNAPRAAEEVERQVVSDVPALVLVAELLGPDDFARFARPLLYDAVMRGLEDQEVARLRGELGASRVVALIREAPTSADGNAWCPRCGDSFTRTDGYCSDCVDVALVPRIQHETPSLTVA